MTEQKRKPGPSQFGPLETDVGEPFGKVSDALICFGPIVLELAVVALVAWLVLIS